MKPQTNLHAGKWVAANPHSIGQFSAVGYFFARELNAKYNIPVGILLCAAGGSCAEGWISEEALKAFPEQYTIAKQLSDTTYMRNLLSSEKSASVEWFSELSFNDLGRKDTPWMSSELDDSNWPTLQIPSSFNETDMDFKNGVAWFRKEIKLPENSTGKVALLELGRIVDSDSAFINGKFIGTTSYQYPPRRYNVEAGILKGGKNIITIRVVSQSGGGAFIKDKPYQLAVNGQIFDLKGTWKYKVAAKIGTCPSSTYFPGEPLGLYNAMLYPVVNYSVKGVVWYQGESNINRPNNYFEVMTTLINEWRTLKNEKELPFLCVQLPNFMEEKKEPSESNLAIIRNHQLKLLSVPNTSMVVTLGLGEWNDIHPLRKKEVGERLALAAANRVYGENNIVYSGPIYKAMKIIENKIELSFDNCGSGLITQGNDKLKYFAIAGADKKYVWAKAIIEGNKVIVSSNQIKNPVAVRYAWADNPEGANLFNTEGLPASPFTTQ
jgi:sialate O-acetylesterase